MVGRYRARRPGFPDTSFCPRIRKVEDCQSKLQRPFPHPGGLKSPDASMDASRRLLFVHRPDRDLGLGTMDTGLGRSIGRGNSTHRQGGGRHAECHGSDPWVCFWATDRGKIGSQTGLFRPLLCIACCLRCPFSHGAGLWNNLQMPRFFRRHDHGGILWLVSSLFT